LDEVPDIVVSAGLIKEVAREVIRERQESGLMGECFKTYHKEGFIRNYPVWEELSFEALEKIRALFKFRPLTLEELGPREQELLLLDRLSFSEISELRALRTATGMFERATNLRYDKGNWEGNTHFSNAEVVAWCGEEARTYMYFVNRLTELGVMKHFEAPDPFVVVKSVRYGTNNHAATPLVNRRTKEVFILDSWVLDGGMPSLIMTMKEWLEDHDSQSNVVGLSRP
jgi:hypothetical protein